MPLGGSSHAHRRMRRARSGAIFDGRGLRARGSHRQPIPHVPNQAAKIAAVIANVEARRMRDSNHNEQEHQP